MDSINQATLINSIIRETDFVIYDDKITLTHVDPSFLVYDGKSPSSWLVDIHQAEYLKTNGKQAKKQSATSTFQRIMLLPKKTRFIGISRYMYLATVKAAIHLQLFEGVDVFVVFVDPLTRYLRRGSYTVVNTKANSSLVWDSSKYYQEVPNAALNRCCGKETQRLVNDLVILKKKARRLQPYRGEYYESKRVSIPDSWKQFLFELCEGKCPGCWEELRNAHIDHEVPLGKRGDEIMPRDYNYEGNSVLFNLLPLCPRCNLPKSNKLIRTSIDTIVDVIENPKLKRYFLYSLSNFNNEVISSISNIPIKY